MDRSYWCEFGDLLPGEKEIGQQRGVRLYDGDDRTSFDSGRVQLTTHRIIWDDEEQEGRTLAFDLKWTLRTETVSSGFRRSAKIKLYLSPSPPNKAAGPSPVARTDHIQLSFRQGGQEQFNNQLAQQLTKKLWEQTPSEVGGGLKLRKGIVGIERNIEKKQRESDKQVNVAFKDLDALIDKAKDMVTTINKFAAKLEEKKGSVSDDETAQFRSYLLTAGISNPVTKETHGSGSTYHKELARELARFLEQPLKEAGGVMTLSDVYCRFNRARGMELVSPDDLVNACSMFEEAKVPLKLRVFDSGVRVIQSAAHSEATIVQQTSQLVTDHSRLTAQELSKLVGIPLMIATERLLIAETAGSLCRDDSVEGLFFYPNRFLQEVN